MRKRITCGSSDFKSERFQIAERNQNRINLWKCGQKSQLKSQWFESLRFQIASGLDLKSLAFWTSECGSMQLAGWVPESDARKTAFWGANTQTRTPGGHGLQTPGPPTEMPLAAAFSLTVGSFLLTVGLPCLQVCFLAPSLTIGAFLLLVGAFLLTIGSLLLTMGKCV